jgi:hypothetical protein
VIKNQEIFFLVNLITSGFHLCQTVVSIRKDTLLAESSRESNGSSSCANSDKSTIRNFLITTGELDMIPG